MDKCIPDNLQTTDTTRVSPEQQQYLLQQIPEWTLVEQHNIQQLQRLFHFRNFAEAMAFTNVVAELAEAADHHPLLITEWGKVRVAWWTHRIKGLHMNDFVMARKTDQALDDLQGSAQLQ